MKNKLLFTLSLSFFLLSCGGNTSSSTPIVPSSEKTAESSVIEPAKSEDKPVKSEEESVEEKTPEPVSSEKEQPSIKSEKSEPIEASSEESPIESEEESQEESSEVDEEEYPSSERFHADVRNYIEPEDPRYGFKPAMSKVLPRIDIVEPNNKTDWATVPSKDNKWDYTDVAVTLTDEDGNVTENIPAGVKVRGNYTANYSKKPFRFKFAKKQAMFGLNNGEKLKSWVLLADVKDASMSRNALTFYLGKTILGSDGYYCSDYRPVEVYINGNYWGVYLLAEQQQINKNRVAIDDPSDRDPSEGKEVFEGVDTGYLVEYDGYAIEEERKADGDPTFHISYHNDAPLTTLSGRRAQQARDYMFNTGVMNGFTVKSDITAETQLTFIQNYFENAYNLIYDAVYNNTFREFNSDYTALVSSSVTSAQECVSKAINVDSFVDTYILNEIACDYDINWSSFYFSADFSETGSKKLTMEAPWDFDSALACRDSAGNGKNYFAAECQNAWMLILQRQSWFQDLVKAKWGELMANHVFHNALHYVDYYRVFYKNYYDQNYTRWGRSEGAGEWRNEIRNLTTQAQHSNYMYNWVLGRLNWLSGQWGDGTNVANETPVTPAKEMGSLIEAQWVASRYEAESCSLSGGTIKTTDNTASDGRYVGDLDGNVGVSMEYSVTSPSVQNAFLKVGLSKRSQPGNIRDWYEFYVNGEEYIPLNSGVPVLSTGERDYHAWTEIDAGSFPLKSGKNTITLVTKGYGTNFDYIDVYAPAKLS